MFADRYLRHHSVTTESYYRTNNEKCRRATRSCKPPNFSSEQEVKDGLNFDAGVRVSPSVQVVSVNNKSQTFSSPGASKSHGPSQYSPLARSHTLLPKRYASKNGLGPLGLHKNGHALPSYRRGLSRPLFRGPDVLTRKLQLQSQESIGSPNPKKNLELLGHSEEKMRELLLRKVTKNPIRQFNFDFESIPSRHVASTGGGPGSVSMDFRGSSTGLTCATRYCQRLGPDYGTLRQSRRRTFLPSLDPEESTSSASDLCSEVAHTEQYSMLDESLYYCPEEEDEMTDLDQQSSDDDDDYLQQYSKVAAGKCPRHKVEEEEEEEEEEGDGRAGVETSRVVFKRNAGTQKQDLLGRDLNDGDQLDGSRIHRLQNSVTRGESSSQSSSLASPSPPLVPLHTCSVELASLQDLPSPHNKSADGHVISSPPLTSSLFPHHFPASINFPMHNEKYTPLSCRQQRLLKYKNSTITPNIVKSCLTRVGYTKSSGGSNLWTMYWGKHMRVESFKRLKDYQKINHFPGTFQIGRKDRLWRNLSKMAGRCGKRDCDFFPQTFVLPHDTLALKKVWEEGSRQKWIIKPPASARGIGIRVVNHWLQIPKKKSVIVQRYLSNPYLINGMKFDLRVYVYVTSYDPLRIYIYREGLARFATCKYSTAMQHISNRFMHLTNYSINKHNSDFTPNTDETVCQGHKWGLLALWHYMNQELGIDTDVVWDSIKDVIIKTIISSEDYISFYVRAYVKNSYCVHELFGFDILLDRHLKPWVLEVNISPSLHSNSQLDVNIKGRLVRDMFNIAGIRLHSRDVLNGIKILPRPPPLTAADKMKHAKFLQRGLSQEDRKQICDYLTNDDLRALMKSEDELSRCGSFERVFPTPKYEEYRKLFENEKYYNMLLGEWTLKYEKCRKKSIEVLRKLADQSQV